MNRTFFDSRLPFADANILSFGAWQLLASADAMWEGHSPSTFIVRLSYCVLWWRECAQGGACYFCLFVCLFFFFYVGKSSRTPCPLLGGVRVVSDSNRLKPHGGLPDVSQKWSGFSCEILPEHFFVFSLFVVKGGVLVLAWAARGEGEPQTP